MVVTREFYDLVEARKVGHIVKLVALVFQINSRLLGQPKPLLKPLRQQQLCKLSTILIPKKRILLPLRTKKKLFMKLMRSLRKVITTNLIRHKRPEHM